MKLVYVAGPFSRPDMGQNVHEAIRAADALLAAGFAPLVPHLSLLWHTVSPKPYETWLAIDLALLERCDAVLRLPGESPGADREVGRARALGIPVFPSVQAVVDKVPA